ncbi:Non-canonical non-ribosomal peptide synthetase FUB8 [Favolaschia claudopus]|uniref:Non-canonical non-ribosomal peptide synthetase FUB8 n=1 Tax=Favolaschia claudopus TaxID=2862362 RepID=A0AAW0CQ44_9AGAR
MLIPDVVELNCKANPSGSFYVFAKPDSEEIATITHLEFHRATHRAAHVLRPNAYGPPAEVVAMISLSDTVLYHAVVVGLITANLIPFPISPRNSAAGILQMLRSASCHRIIATCTTLGPLLAELRKHITENDAEFQLTVEEIPSLGEIYPNLGVENSACVFQPYPSQTPPQLDDICLYMHSSGSSGLPKTIAQTHRALMQWCQLPAVTEARDILEKPFANMLLPSFHQFGIICQLLQPLFGTCAAVYPPTATSASALPIFPTSDNVLDNARRTKCRTLTTVPALLAAWVHSPSAIDYLKTLHTVAWSGGPLPRKMGDALVGAGVNLIGVYGATEIGPITSIVPYQADAEDWSWMRVSDAVDVRWASQGDGTFECQILASEKFTPAVQNLSDVKGYRTFDLFVNHPEKKHLWRVVGRVDDVIVHTSGEKTVPAPMEDIINSSPDISGAVMFGSGRAQTGVIIETVPRLQIDDVQDATQLAELRNRIWATIEEANHIAPAFSRIFKELIILASRDKPLPRAGKGTVLRKAALNLYDQEIATLYDTIEEQAGMVEVDPPNIWNLPTVQQWLITLATSLVNSTLSPTEDLFEQGFDSLSATVLRLRILAALRSAKLDEAQKAITQSLVYLYPTIAQLAVFLDDLVNTGSEKSGTTNTGTQIVDMIKKHSSSQEVATTVANVRAINGQDVVVLLTGSTGNLGSQILATLLNDSRVVKVYALNRSVSGRTLAERQFGVFSERGLDMQLLASEKLELIETQLTQNNLGLAPGVYEQIRDSVTLIIHNAWMLDFNKSLASFEPHILGTRHLIDFALLSTRRLRFLFTSSIDIASAQLWDSSGGPCPEDLLTDSSVALGGYGQSKYVVEQILAQSNLDSCSLRIGQLCGALPRGAWATSDWVPILVKSSRILGLLPVAHGVVSWLDFETVSKIIMDIAFSTAEESAKLPAVLNIVHPRPISWNSVISYIRDASFNKCGDNRAVELKLASFADWFQELEASEARGVEELPALKLLEFFRNLNGLTGRSSDEELAGPSFSCEKAQSLSSAMRMAPPITQQHVESWVSYWSDSGFL